MKLLSEKRNHKKKSLQKDIKDIENFISRSEDTIKRLQTSCFNTEYVVSETEKLENIIQKKKDELEIIEDFISKINTGELDDTINQEYIDNKNKITCTSKKAADKKLKDAKESKINKETSKQFTDNIYHDKKINKQSEKDVEYGYKYFTKIVNSLPDYMINKLNEMPNNKGYYWRGVCFYGKMPDENPVNHVVLFEKMKGNVLHIHEYTPTEYIKYEKVGTNRKKIISVQPKKIKKEITLFDYVKKDSK